MERMRGNEENDILVVGDFGLLLHWNGISWHRYVSISAIYYGLAVRGDVVGVVGQQVEGFVGGDPVLLVGRRY